MLKFFVSEAVVVVKSELLAVEVVKVVDIPVCLRISAHDMDYVEAQENYGIEEENEVDAVNLEEDDKNIGETPAIGNANVRSESVNLPPRPPRAPRARKTTSIA